METAAPWPVGIQLVSREEAARAFEACAAFAPDAQTTPQGVAADGDCYRFTTPAGVLTYSASVLGECYWVNGAAGTGRQLTERGLAAIEYQARQFGCRRVGFTTVRPGLIRKAERLGYQIEHPDGAGFKLTKELPHG